MNLFWVDAGQGALYSADLDGSNAMEILDVNTLGLGTFIPRGITTNGTNLFWTDTSQDALYSSNLDGSDAMEILDLTTTFGPGEYSPNDITTDGTNLFWVDLIQERLYSSNLDGSNAMEILDLTTLGSGSFFPEFITITPLSQPQSVPEPTSILGLITLGGLAFAKSRRDALK